MSHSHNNAARCFCAEIDGKIAAYISVLHFPHPKVKNMKKVHRLVVLPDYQGIGLGNKLLEVVGEYYKKQSFRFNIQTSAPSLIFALKKNKKWALTRKGRVVRDKLAPKTNSVNRITTSWELK